VIRLTKLNGFEIVVNPELIEWMESNPDTTITLATGSKIIVKNKIDDVVAMIMNYRKELISTGKNPSEAMLKSYKKEI